MREPTSGRRSSEKEASQCKSSAPPLKRGDFRGFWGLPTESPFSWNGPGGPQAGKTSSLPKASASPADFYSHLEDLFDTVSRRVRGKHWSKYRSYRSACRGVRTYPLEWTFNPDLRERLI